MTTTPKLDALIACFIESESSAGRLNHAALVEIREHLQRIPAKQEPTRYPSEIETRLIELVEHCIKGIYDVKRSQAACLQLAAIKRDLGLL